MCSQSRGRKISVGGWREGEREGRRRKENEKRGGRKEGEGREGGGRKEPPPELI